MSEPIETIPEAETPSTVEVYDVGAKAELAALVPVGSALVRPAGTPTDVAEAFTEYAQVCERVLDDGDYQQIGNKKFRTKSAWRKLAVAYGVNLALVEERVERDQFGGLLRVHTTVRATAPNGRFADGVGSCDCDERSFSHLEHDVRGTAFTRAANRASADLFGLGEVSAEEVDGGGPEPQVEWVTVDTLKEIRRVARVIGQSDETKIEPLVHWPSSVLGTACFDPVEKRPLITEPEGWVLLEALCVFAEFVAVDLTETPDTIEQAVADTAAKMVETAAAYAPGEEPM